MIVEQYPDATHTCSFHSALSDSDKQLRAFAKDWGFEIVLASHDTSNLAFYDNCDLHVGYRLHGHISFLRRRLPSILVGEDVRGNGFNTTLATAGFPATRRRLGPRPAKIIQSFGQTLPEKGLQELVQKTGLSPRPYRELIAPPDLTAPDKTREFLQQVQTNRFESYEAVPGLFDGTYQNTMKPFLENLP